MTSCVVEAMHCRSDLGVNKRRTKRIVHECELRGEGLQTVEGVQIAEELRCQTFFINNLLGDARAARVLCQTCPCATARALQVDRGDLPVSRGRTEAVNFHNRAHAAAVKRGFRLPRPVLTNVATMVLTTMSGWLSARNSTRQPATQPLSFGLTSIVPV